MLARNRSCTISSFCASAAVKLVTTHISEFGTSLGPWILVAVFLVAVFSSMHFLNRGLASGQALMVVPGFFTLNTMLAMMCTMPVDGGCCCVSSV